MPLYHGKKNVGRNIKTLLGEGRPPDQAKAIALKKAGMSRQKGRSKK
jgi:hypothetical protein